MKYVQLGQTDVNVSLITMGAWAIGNYEIGGIDQRDAISAMHKGYELGCTTIDTAPVYNIGLSEEVVARAISDWPRDKVQILTKCGIVWEGTKGHPYFQGVDFGDRKVNFYKYAGKESIIGQCEQSLKRLKTDYVDLFSIHWPDITTPIEESMEAFNILIQQGKIRAAGLANYHTKDMKQAESVCCIAANKIRYSMLNKSVEAELVPYCLETKKTMLAYSIMQRGILSGEEVPTFLWPEGYDNPREVVLYETGNRKLINEFLDKIRPLAHDNGATLSQLVIRWVLEQPGAPVALLGATSPGQMEHDARSADIPFSKSDMDFINLHLKELEGKLVLPSEPWFV